MSASENLCWVRSNQLVPSIPAQRAIATASCKPYASDSMFMVTNLSSDFPALHFTAWTWHEGASALLSVTIKILVKAITHHLSSLLIGFHTRAKTPKKSHTTHKKNPNPKPTNQKNPTPKKKKIRHPTQKPKPCVHFCYCRYDSLCLLPTATKVSENILLPTAW